MKDEINKLNDGFRGESAENILGYFISRYASVGNVFGTDDRIALASSLGAEDQVLTDMVMKLRPGMRIFILDTGRLPEETYALMIETMARYGMRYEVYYPEARDVEELVSRHGPDPFYESVSLRKLCCTVRKVRPLARALAGLDAWITGLRRDQSVTRNSIEKIAWDDEHVSIKVNPLADWTEERVWDYICKNNVPYNKLHDSGYPSIGCKPCTRAIKPGEDLRAGRWWWETPEQKECGLHISDGKLVRKNG